MVPFFVLKYGFVSMRDVLMRLLEPLIEAQQLELVDIEYANSSGGGVLRIFVDTRAGEAAVSEVLEAQDPIKGHYTLEVSSPGFDRILRTRAHFERFLGKRIVAELKLPLEGRRRFVGVLQSLDGESIVIDVDGKVFNLPLERIQKARVRPE